MAERLWLMIIVILLDKIAKSILAFCSAQRFENSEGILVLAFWFSSFTGSECRGHSPVVKRVHHK
jgi:hypothetical protein